MVKRIKRENTKTGKPSIIHLVGCLLIGIMVGRSSSRWSMDTATALNASEKQQVIEARFRNEEEQDESFEQEEGAHKDTIAGKESTDPSRATTMDSSPQSATSTTTSTAKTTSYPDWPAVAIEELGHPLVKIGTNFIDNAKELLLQHWDEFMLAYANRPDKVNMCGIRINHAYALWLTVKHLNITTVIESGVNAGQSTYFIRMASPTANIIAIDPLEKPICNQGKRWVDTSGKATYYTGHKFLDFSDIKWKDMIADGEIDPSTTLVFLDDHLEVFKRFVAIMKFGFRHVMLEDNYKKGEGATSGDKAGYTMKQMFHRKDKDSEFLFNQLRSYAEFPPIVPPIMAKASQEPRKAAGGFLHASDKNTDIVAPLFRPDIIDDDKKVYEKMCQELGLNSSLVDGASYMQVMNYNQICYLEVRPLAPYLARNWKR